MRGTCLTVGSLVVGNCIARACYACGMIAVGNLHAGACHTCGIVAVGNCIARAWCAFTRAVRADFTRRTWYTVANGTEGWKRKPTVRADTLRTVIVTHQMYGT